MNQELETTHSTDTVNSGDVTLFFRKFGNPGKTPVLILHGLSFFSYDWINIADAWSADREVVAWDMRGFGESSWSPDREYGLKTIANDVITLLDQFNWPKVVLVGHSFGGRVALATSDWFPNRIEKLVCVDFAPDVAREGRMVVADRIGNQPDYFSSISEALAYHGEDENAPPESDMYRRYEAFLKPEGDRFVLRRDLHFRDNFKKTLESGKPAPIKVDLWGMMEGLSIPTLVIRGKQSNMFAPETLEKCRAANKSVTAIELDGGHDLAGDNPDGVTRAVGEFLANDV